MEQNQVLVFSVRTHTVDGSGTHKLFAEYVSYGQAHELILNDMATGISNFTYTTASGEERRAFGTLAPDLIINRTVEDIKAMGALLREFHDYIQDPALFSLLVNEPETKEDKKDLIIKLCKGLGVFPVEETKKKARSSSGTNQAYYDMEVKQWRSFVPERLVSVNVRDWTHTI